MSKSYQYLFGPVPSRRLGRSLGVDLIPFKTCTMNCRFCQLGDSECALSERAAYVPIQDVLHELQAWLDAGGEADHLTLAGSGEPTLHTQFGDVFRWAKEHTDIATVLLSNGSLLYLPEVREEAALADKVKVTLSAWDESSFQQIHHPAVGITFAQLVEGERKFRQEFSGELSVEVFIIEGVNSSVEQAEKMAALVQSIAPDRIDLNTAVRPPADTGVKACSEEQMNALAEVFGPKASVTASFKKKQRAAAEVSEDVLLGLIKRHPATAKQLAEQFGAAEEALVGLLVKMVSAGQLLEENRGGDIYYFCRD
jgi:wyosine [tRNA(Phe)-imidazoG37] synthetase (radical SAM superfamily)